jgi:hypothetical protein
MNSQGDSIFCLEGPTRLSTRDSLAGCKRLPQKRDPLGKRIQRPLGAAIADGKLEKI